MARRLMTIPGLGPVTASAMATRVQDISVFSGPREFAAFLGLTPRQNSSGGKERLGRVSKMGNRYLRKLLVVGACSPLSSHAAPRRAAIMGEEAHADQALQACRRRARQ
jgi:transposase